MTGHGAQEIARQIRSRRVSALVAVPKILEVLRDFVVASISGGQRSQARARTLAAAMVAIPPRASPARLEILGVHFRRRAACAGCRAVLVEARVSGRARLRAHGNRADRHAQPSLSCSQRNRREAARRRRSQNRRRRRGAGARRQRDHRILSARPKRPRRYSKTAGSIRATSGISTPKAICRFAAARRK